MKKFLVVGNGFDLAHNLPTKYSDFLYFLVLCIDCASDWENWISYDTQNNYRLEKSAFYNILHNPLNKVAVKDIFDENIDLIKQTLQSELIKNFLNNDLLKYFICVYASKLDLNYDFQWIDVEDELMNFVIDFNKTNNISVRSIIYLNIIYQEREKIILKNFYCKDIARYLKTLSNIPADKVKSKVFEYIFRQLEQFSALLKFYLQLIMNKFHKENKLYFKFSSDVDDHFYFSHIISFNYTNTSKIYNPDAKIYYVNGSLKYDNIILGFENPFSSASQEYCDDNVHLFFKNVQRILYDFKYKHNRWFESKKNDFYLEDIGKKGNDNLREVYMVGHSLTLSDKFILLDIIEQSDKITIYYFNDNDKKSKITNLYKILGDEKFYKYVNNNSAKHKIILKPQSEIELKIKKLQ